MDSPGKNTGMGCHFLLQGIFPTQGLNPHLLGSLPLASPGKPRWLRMLHLLLQNVPSLQGRMSNTSNDQIFWLRDTAVGRTLVPQRCLCLSPWNLTWQKGLCRHEVGNWSWNVWAQWIITGILIKEGQTQKETWWWKQRREMALPEGGHKPRHAGGL